MGYIKISYFRIVVILIFLNWMLFTYNVVVFIFQPKSSSSSPSPPLSYLEESVEYLSISKGMEHSEDGRSREAFRHMLKNNSAYDNIDNNKRESILNYIRGVQQMEDDVNDKESKGEARREVIIKSNENSTQINKEYPGGEEYLIPNIVHFIWYAEQDIPLQFHHMLSILSAHKFINPSSIYFHSNHPPVGKYWQAVLQLDNFIVNYREPPKNLFGQPLKPPPFYTSYSNVDRVKVLIEMGGIYLDLDVIVTRSFHSLRKLPCVIAREQDTQACGSVIACTRDSPFLLLWLNSYLDDYQDQVWAYNSGKVPFNLANRYPHLVHMDDSRINRPNFDELRLIWGEGRFDWWNNYAVHIWYRVWRDQSKYFNGIEPNEDNIKSWNSSFGEMARSVLYGSARLMDCD